MNTRIAAVTTVTAIILVGAISLLSSLPTQSAYAFVFTGEIESIRKAPIATSGGNVYIVWFTDKGTPNSNGEVMFKASTDSGKTFGNKTNLSNTPNVDSINAEISAAGTNVYVSWWERNATNNEPVLRISNDNGKTFGEIIKLSGNSTTSP
jgi:tricorn protease-like protein